MGEYGRFREGNILLPARKDFWLASLFVYGSREC
jgi:hypothetical protein